MNPATAFWVFVPLSIAIVSSVDSYYHNQTMQACIAAKGEWVYSKCTFQPGKP